MELEESLKITKDKFFKYFDIEDDPSETAYFTGTVKPDINDINLWQLMLLGTEYNEFKPRNCNTKEEYIIEVLNGFLLLGDLVREKIQKIFNPWRF